MSLKIVWHALQGLFTTCGGIIGWYLGGFDGFLYTLIAFVVIDYVTGVFAAAATGRLSSKTGFIGIARKLTIFLLVGAANLVDLYVLKEGGTLRTATIFFYLSNEGISLLENTTVLGLPVPEPLKQALALITKNAPGNNIATAPRQGRGRHLATPATSSSRGRHAAPVNKPDEGGGRQ